MNQFGMWEFCRHLQKHFSQKVDLPDYAASTGKTGDQIASANSYVEKMQDVKLTELPYQGIKIIFASGENS